MSVPLAGILGGFQALGGVMGSVGEETDNLAKSTKEMAGTFGNSVNQITNFGNSLNRLYTTQVDMEKQLGATGYSVSNYNNQLKILSATTNLSRSEISSFYSQLVKTHDGFKDMSALRIVQQNIAAIGITAENTSAQLTNFSQAQSKIYDLDEKLARKESLSIAQRQRLTAEQRATYDAALAYSRTGFQAGDPAERRQLEMTQKLTKEWENASLKLKESFLPVLQSAADIMISIIKYVGQITEGLKPLFSGLGALGGGAGAFGNKATGPINGGLSTGEEQGAGLGAFLLGGAGLLGVAKGARSMLGGGGGSGGGGGGGFLGWFAGKDALHNQEIGGELEQGKLETTEDFEKRVEASREKNKDIKRAKRSVKMRRFGVGAAVSMLASPVISSLYENNVAGNLDEDTDKGIRKAGNVAESGLAMAGMGAAAGSLAGPIGTAIGAVLGGGFGMYQGMKQEVEDRNAPKPTKPEDISTEYKNDELDARKKDIMNAVNSGQMDGVTARKQLFDDNQKDLEKQEQFYRDKGEIEKANQLKAGREDGSISKSASENGLIEGIEEAQAAMRTFKQVTDSAAGSYSNLSKIAEQFSYNSTESSRMLMEKHSLLNEQIPLMQEALNAQKATTAVSIEDYNNAVKTNASAAKRKELQQGIVESKAREATLSNQLKEQEVDMLKVRHEAVMAEVRVKQELNNVAQDYADTEKSLTEALRLGFGASYESIRKSIAVRGEGVKIAELEVDKWRQIASSAKTAEERQYAMVELTKSQTKLMKSQVGYMKDINDLRVGYIDALGESAMGGLSSEWNPTKDSGIVHFMGMGKNKGASAVGGVGGPEGNSDYAARMGPSGQITPGGQGNNLNSYANDGRLEGMMSGIGGRNGGPANTGALTALGYNNPTGANNNIAQSGVAMGPMGGRNGVPGQPGQGMRVNNDGSGTITVTPFADGGIVNKPTLSLSGEAGPEAFVPLKGGAIPVKLMGGNSKGGEIASLVAEIRASQAMYGAYEKKVEAETMVKAMARVSESISNLAAVTYDRKDFSSASPGGQNSTDIGDNFRNIFIEKFAKNFNSDAAKFTKFEGPAATDSTYVKDHAKIVAEREAAKVAERASNDEKTRISNGLGFPKQSRYVPGPKLPGQTNRTADDGGLPGFDAMNIEARIMANGMGRLDTGAGGSSYMNMASIKPIISTPLNTTPEVRHQIDVNGQCTTCNTKHTVSQLSSALGSNTHHNVVS